MESRRRGIFLLVSAGLALGVHTWISRGAFLTLQNESERLEYLFISAGLGSLAVCLLLGPAVLYVAHRMIRRAASRHGATNPPPFTGQDVSWAKPLLLFWASALALLTVAPGAGRLLSVVSFLIVDLRVWWTLVVAGVTAFGIYRRAGVRPLFLPAPFSRWRFAPEAALVAICALWAIGGTPNLRFTAGLHGDEPKYMRYCENFYQGLGLEVSSIRPIAELPPDFQSRFSRNLTLIANTLPGELRELASDARLFMSDPSHRFARSLKTRGFIKGKNGGEYQVHQPGLSVLMLPAYYIDRQITPVEHGSTAQWPNRLLAVHTFFLALYVLWVVLIFRFVRRLVQRTWVAWLTALTMGLTMPVAAFPFQFYPEVAAGVLLFAIAGHLLFPAHATPAAAFFVGLLTGYLPWLHVRFSALAAVLVLTGVIVMRRDARRLASFLTGFAVPAICLALYAYRLTGSVLPSAVWNEEDGSAVLSASGALRGSVAYLIDRQWGLLAHSPVYLLALPGYWLLAKRRDVAWLCALVLLSVLLPSAAHTLSGATPNRLIVAVVPFAAIPIAVVIVRYARSRAFQATFAVLLLLSLQNALAYNWSHFKDVSRMIDHSFSGWKVNLLFPALSRTPWVTTENGWLYVGWVAILIAALFGPALLHRARERGWNLRGPAWAHSVPQAMLVLTLMIVLLATTVAAGTGAWEKPDYRAPAVATARRAAESLEAMGDCALCLSSVAGRITTDQALADLLLIDPSLGASGDPGSEALEYDDWLRMPGRIRSWYVEANGHEPSNEDLGHYLFQWREEHTRPEEVRRRIFRAANKPAP